MRRRINGRRGGEQRLGEGLVGDHHHTPNLLAGGGDHAVVAVHQPSPHRQRRNRYEPAIAIDARQAELPEPHREPALAKRSEYSAAEPLPVLAIIVARFQQFRPHRVDVDRDHTPAPATPRRGVCLLDEHLAASGAPPRGGAGGGWLEG